MLVLGGDFEEVDSSGQLGDVQGGSLDLIGHVLRQEDAAVQSDQLDVLEVGGADADIQQLIGRLREDLELHRTGDRGLGGMAGFLEEAGDNTVRRRQKIDRREKAQIGRRWWIVDPYPSGAIASVRDTDGVLTCRIAGAAEVEARCQGPDGRAEIIGGARSDHLACARIFKKATEVLVGVPGEVVIVM